MAGRGGGAEYNSEVKNIKKIYILAKSSRLAGGQ